MTNAEMQLGRITAIIEAANGVIEQAQKNTIYHRDTITMAKETAYDSIKGIIDDPAYCPWQE